MVIEDKTSDKSIRRLVLAGELVALNAALLALSLIGEHLTGNITPHYKRLMVLMSLVYLVCEMRGRHKIDDRFVRGDQLMKSLLSNLSTFIGLSLLVMWVFRWPLLTWSYMLPFYGFIIVFISLFRWAARQAIKRYRSNGGNTMQVIFIGNINICSKLFQQMESDPTAGYHIVGYFNDEPKENVTKKGYLGTSEEALTYLEEHGGELHNVYCMLPSSQNDLINALMLACDQNIVRYYHIPDAFNYQRHHMGIDVMANTPIFSIHYEPLASLSNRMLKRGFDLAFSTVFLVLVFPWVYLIFGFLIKRSSPGPIFFKQKRSGLEGKEFYCLKFRSMKVNVDSDTVQATKDDPRKTRIGEFMRKTSIDELPQFINVWKGEMSIVGPRPHMVKHTEQYSALIGNYMVRHFAKPGITGYAQVTGSRGETKELWQMEERVQKDIWYIEHWTFALDLFIIVKTITNALQGEKEAY